MEPIPVESQALGPRRVVESEVAAIQGRRFAFAMARNRMGEGRAIGVPDPLAGRVETGPRIGEPVLAVDGKLDRQLVVVGVAALQSGMQASAAHRQKEAGAAPDEEPEIRVGDGLQVIEHRGVGKCDDGDRLVAVESDRVRRCGVIRRHGSCWRRMGGGQPLAGGEAGDDPAFQAQAGSGEIGEVGALEQAARGGGEGPLVQMLLGEVVVHQRADLE